MSGGWEVTYVGVLHRTLLYNISRLYISSLKKNNSNKTFLYYEYYENNMHCKFDVQHLA